MPLWISFTLFAVCMQSLRTAAQKQLAGNLSVSATTLVRYLFGLPFAALYFLFIALEPGDDKGTLVLVLPSNLFSESRFILSAALAGLAQILATYFLIQTLLLRNFSVGTALAKTQALQAAIIGSVFFNEPLHWLGYLSVGLGVIGVLFISNVKVSQYTSVDRRALVFGLGSGLLFAMTSWFVRDASLALEGPRLLAAATVLLVTVSLQTLLCLAWVCAKQRDELKRLRQNLAACWFIGITSLAGSIGWFTANTLQNPALVNTVGQIEFVVTLLITHFYFSEKIMPREGVGMLLIVIGIYTLLQVS